MIFAAFDLDSNQQPVDHGKITAFIRYRTLYHINNKRDPYLISFALSNDISIHCVLGIHPLLRLGGTIDLVNGELSYSKTTTNL